MESYKITEWPQMKKNIVSAVTLTTIHLFFSVLLTNFSPFSFLQSYPLARIPKSVLGGALSTGFLQVR